MANAEKKATGFKRRKHLTGVNHGKTCNGCQALENTDVICAVRWKICNRCQVRVNMKPVLFYFNENHFSVSSGHSTNFVSGCVSAH